jgi:hypothetical protein
MLDDHIAFNDEVLPHVFFGDVTRYIVKGFDLRSPNRAEACQLLALFERGLEEGDEDVDNLICVSFLEGLPVEEQYHRIRGAMGPLLRTEATRYEQ